MVFTALVLGITVFLAPRLISRVAAELRMRVLAHPWVPDTVTGMAWLLPTTVVVRMPQLVVFVGATPSLSPPWDYAGLTTDLIELFAVVVPNAVKFRTIVALLAGALAGTNVLKEKLDLYTTISDSINTHQQGIVSRALQLVVLLTVGMVTLTV